MQRPPYRRFSKLSKLFGTFDHHFIGPTTMFYMLFCLQNTALVLRYQIPCLQTVPVLSGAF